QTLAIDLLNPSAAYEQRQHKLKRLVQSPNSYFMDVKCPGCFTITTVFSHAHTVVLCGSCASVLCQPTGGKARLTEGSSAFRRKGKQSPYLLALRLFIPEKKLDVSVLVLLQTCITNVRILLQPRKPPLQILPP
ncbi:ribosomal protein S27-domain-containing protein, partial [Mycena rosella]